MNDTFGKIIALSLFAVVFWTFYIAVESLIVFNSLDLVKIIGN